jgi:hypothetical protein
MVFDLHEANDPADLSTYGMSTFSYEGQFLGLLRRFHNGHEIDLELAHSDDDHVWKRTTPGKPFIPLGPSGTFDAGMVFSSNSPVVVGDELWFYYGAFNGHHEEAEKKQSAAIGLAKLRRDGFVSFSSNDELGELRTAPLQFKGEQLQINAVATQGELTVEIRDELGVPQPGFTFADCDKFHGDSTSHAIKWRGESDIGRFREKTVQLAFRLKNASLFAFQFQ